MRKLKNVIVLILNDINPIDSVKSVLKFIAWCIPGVLATTLIGYLHGINGRLSIMLPSNNEIVNDFMISSTSLGHVLISSLGLGVFSVMFYICIAGILLLLPLIYWLMYAIPVFSLEYIKDKWNQANR